MANKHQVGTEKCSTHCPDQASAKRCDLYKNIYILYLHYKIGILQVFGTNAIVLWWQVNQNITCVIRLSEEIYLNIILGPVFLRPSGTFSFTLNPDFDLFCDRTDDEWRVVLTRFIGARAEEGVDCVSETIHKCIDEHLSLHVVKWHLSFIAVDKDADARGSETGWQGRGRLCAEGVVCPVAQTQEPVAVGRTHRNLALTVDGATGHTQVPVCLVPDFHLVTTNLGYGTLSYAHTHTLQPFTTVKSTGPNSETLAMAPNVL